jgi:hypothetical protein
MRHPSQYANCRTGHATVADVPGRGGTYGGFLLGPADPSGGAGWCPIIPVRNR